jgi:hypothetical protein
MGTNILTLLSGYRHICTFISHFNTSVSIRYLRKKIFNEYNKILYVIKN